jgi:haloalkane dehalogenase
MLLPLAACTECRWLCSMATLQLFGNAVMRIVRRNSLKFFGTFIVFLAISILSGCASTASNETRAINYKQYLEDFKAKNTFIDHTLTRADGHNINAREFGIAFKGKSPTIVMMHGFPDNQYLYDLLVPLLSNTRHVVTFDFLGWGKSQSPVGQKYPVSVQVEDIRTVMSSLKLDMVDIVVHDLSGHPGIDWALANAEKVAKLVLLNTYYTNTPTLKAPDAIEFYSKPGWLRDLATWGATKAPSRFEGGLASQLNQFISTPTIRDKFVPIFVHDGAYMRPAFFSSVAYLWAEIEAREKELPKMRAFAKPVQIIFGENDPSLNPGVAADFQKIFKNSKVTMIKDAGHYVQLDKPEAIADLIR